MSTPAPWPTHPLPSVGVHGVSSTGSPWSVSPPAYSFWSSSWATVGVSGVGSDTWWSSSSTPLGPAASSAVSSSAAVGRPLPGPTFPPVDPRMTTRDPRVMDPRVMDPRMVPVDPRMLSVDTSSPPYSTFPGMTSSRASLTSSALAPMDSRMTMAPARSPLYSRSSGTMAPRAGMTSSAPVTSSPPMFPERPRPLPEAGLRPPPPSYAEAMRDSAPMELPRPPSRSAWAWTRRVTSIWPAMAVVPPHMARAPASREGTGRRAGRQPGPTRGTRPGH